MSKRHKLQISTLRSIDDVFYIVCSTRLELLASDVSLTLEHSL